MQREIDLIFNDTYVQRGKQFLRPEHVETTPPSPEQLRPLLAHKYCYPSGHCSLSEFVDSIVTETVSSSDTRQQLSATENVATPHFLVNRPTSSVSPIPTHPWMYRGLLEETKLPPPPGYTYPPAQIEDVEGKLPPIGIPLQIKPSVRQNQSQGLQTQPPELQTHPLILQIQSPELQNKPPGLPTQPPGLHNKSPGLQTQPPVLRTQPQNLQTLPPGLQIHPPGLHNIPTVPNSHPSGLYTHPPGLHNMPSVLHTHPPGIYTHPLELLNPPPALSNNFHNSDTFNGERIAPKYYETQAPPPELQAPPLILQEPPPGLHVYDMPQPGYRYKVPSICTENQSSFSTNLEQESASECDIQVPPTGLEYQVTPPGFESEITPLVIENHTPQNWLDNNIPSHWLETQVQSTTYEHQDPLTEYENQATPTAYQNQALTAGYARNTPRIAYRNQIYPPGLEIQSPPTHQNQDTGFDFENQSTPTEYQNQAPFIIPEYRERLTTCEPQTHPLGYDNPPPPTAYQNQAPPSIFEYLAQPSNFESHAHPISSESQDTPIAYETHDPPNAWENQFTNSRIENHFTGIEYVNHIPPPGYPYLAPPPGYALQPSNQFCAFHNIFHAKKNLKCYWGDDRSPADILEDRASFRRRNETSIDVRVVDQSDGASKVFTRPPKLIGHWSKRCRGVTCTCMFWQCSDGDICSEIEARCTTSQQHRNGGPRTNSRWRLRSSGYVTPPCGRRFYPIEGGTASAPGSARKGRPLTGRSASQSRGVADRAKHSCRAKQRADNVDRNCPACDACLDRRSVPLGDPFSNMGEFVAPWRSRSKVSYRLKLML